MRNMGTKHTNIMKDMKILLNIAHSNDTPGKRSPDGKFREWEYSKLICSKVKEELESFGFTVKLIRQETFYGPSQGLVQVVRDINKECESGSCILVSIHVNAAGNGKDWFNATGWSAYTSPGKTKSDLLADDLYWAAGEVLRGKKIRTDMKDGDKDFEENFYILRATKCPAVLTENFFQDCKSDVEYLSSPEGIHDIVKLHVDGILAYLQRL